MQSSAIRSKQAHTTHLGQARAFTEHYLSSATTRRIISPHAILLAPQILHFFCLDCFRQHLLKFYFRIVLKICNCFSSFHSSPGELLRLCAEICKFYTITRDMRIKLMQTIYFSETDNGLDIVDGAYIALLFIKNILRQNRTHPPTIKHSNLAPSLYSSARN